MRNVYKRALDIDVTHVVDTSSMADEILADLSIFTRRERILVHLYYRCGLTHLAMARILDVHRSSVSRSMSNVRKKLLARARSAAGSPPPLASLSCAVIVTKDQH